MAANKSQGRTFTIFLAGLTVAAAGLAYIATGLAKVALVVGLLIIAFSFLRFLRIKPLEGTVPDGKQPATLKLAGLGTVLAGWLIVLFGINLTAGVAGRMIATLIGLAVSLLGILVVLPLAANKNAIWKS